MILGKYPKHEIHQSSSEEPYHYYVVIPWELRIQPGSTESSQGTHKSEKKLKKVKMKKQQLMVRKRIMTLVENT